MNRHGEILIIAGAVVLFLLAVLYMAFALRHNYNDDDDDDDDEDNEPPQVFATLDNLLFFDSSNVGDNDAQTKYFNTVNFGNNCEQGDERQRIKRTMDQIFPDIFDRQEEVNRNELREPLL